ncbi:MAG TPA: hypothetical protein DCR39_08870 [Nitrospiraceae bacterium]|nr:hypothetical protein [Nitrospiraceae bacterium]
MVERQSPMKSFLLYLIVSFLCLCISLVFPVSSWAGIRGAPEGESGVKIGDKAPLETEDLKRAHKEGKVILLMFGNPDHCRYCEKVWFNIMDIGSRYEQDVAVIVKRHRAAEFWGPESEDSALGKRYGVIGEPWLFIIGNEGIVRYIFRGFAGLTEIESQLKKVLGTP